MPGPSCRSARRRSSSTGCTRPRSRWIRLPARHGSDCRFPGSTTSTTRSERPPSLQSLGASLEEIRAGLERFGAAFGRFERIPAGDKTLLVLLIKNPAGANEVVHTLLEGGAPSLLLVALNDAIADGKDVSWIWDVDFEPLLARSERLIASGERAAELGLRCVYGGLPEAKLDVEPSLGRAIDRGLDLTAHGGELVVLPTYTAMLELQRIFAERGWSQPYWERT